MKRWQTLTALAGLITVAGAAYWFGSRSEQLPMGDSVVARIGEREITVNDFIDEMAARGGHLPGQYHQLEQRRALLEAMIEQELLVLGAINAGLDQDPEVRRTIRRVLISRYREQLLNEKLATLEVTEAEVSQYYEAHEQDYTRPERRRAAIIFAAVGPKASPETRAAARARIEQASLRVAELEPAVRHFGKLALEYSDDRSTRYLGGVIGWLMAMRQDRYKWDKAVIDSIFAMTEAGQTSGVIETGQGFYLTRLVELESEVPQALSSIAPSLKRVLMKQKTDAMRQDIFDSVKSGIEFEVNDRVLAQIEPLSQPAPGQPKPPALPRPGNGN